MTFLPSMEKILAEARKKKTQLEQLDYVFKSDNVCIKTAKELTIEERNDWCSFYGLKIVAVPIRKEKKEEKSEPKISPIKKEESIKKRFRVTQLI